MPKLAFNDHLFRGYDLRGVAGEDLDVDRIYILGNRNASFCARNVFGAL